MMGRIVAITGAHGTGKTTAAYELAAGLKRSERGEVGIILEVARCCPFAVLTRATETTREAQMWIFAEQIRRELEFAARYDWVVSDRTVVDSIAYSSLAGFHDLAAAQVAMARHHVGIYHRVIFRGNGDFRFLVDDDFRSTDPDTQAEVQRLLLELYAELGVSFEWVEYGMV